MIKYPIKHGRLDGKSIWVEHELITFLKKWKMIDTAGTWMAFDADLIKDAEEKLKITIKPKHQGFNQLLTYLEDTPTLTDYLFQRVRMVEGK